MGLFGAFSSVSTLVSGIAGMGITTSGVRQIAEAVGAEDPQKVARTAFVLRRTSLTLGLVGMVSLWLLCRPISILTFGDAGKTWALALLALVVLCTSVSGGQTALIQGLRRIKDLAALTVWGGVLGTLCSIPIIYFFREKGIVPFLLCVALLGILTSWWYVRRVPLPVARVSLREVWSEARLLLGMGSVFMASSLMTTGVAYLTRVLIIRQLGLDAAGLFQASSALSVVYVGFVLNAMGADYYPRLTAVAGDNAKVNRLVNEQTEAALLMAVPGILGTMTCASLVLHVLYSSQFEPAVEILRWQILGILGRVVAWPIGFVLLAKGEAVTFFWTELLFNAFHIALIFLGINYEGVAGVGMAFCVMYLFYSAGIWCVVHRLSGFQWSRTNQRLLLATVALAAMVFLVTSLHQIPSLVRLSVGLALTALAGGYALRRLEALLGKSLIGAFMSKIRSIFGRART